MTLNGVDLSNLNGRLRNMKSGVLKTHMVGSESLCRAFGVTGMRGSLLMPALSAQPQSEYLTFHRDNVFRG